MNNITEIIIYLFVIVNIVFLLVNRIQKSKIKKIIRRKILVNELTELNISIGKAIYKYEKLDKKRLNSEKKVTRKNYITIKKVFDESSLVVEPIFIPMWMKIRDLLTPKIFLMRQFSSGKESFNASLNYITTIKNKDLRAVFEEVLKYQAQLLVISNKGFFDLMEIKFLGKLSKKEIKENQVSFTSNVTKNHSGNDNLSDFVFN